MVQQTNETILMDATDAVVGRLAAFAAKQSLLGKKVVIVNSENSILIGNKKSILEKYASRIARGTGRQKGPYFPRTPERILRRAIRGMLPFEKARGREALKRVMCYNSSPKEFEAAKKITFKKEKRHADSITLKELSTLI
jgi:large subunit ribosomal protein L13